MSKEEKNTYTIKTDENLGEIKIADEVVAIIAAVVLHPAFCSLCSCEICRQIIKLKGKGIRV